MFTGIVEELGIVRALEWLGDSVRLTVGCRLVVSDAAAGASISVNGCCLTVTDHDASSFGCDVMRETLDHTSLGAFTVGTPVNLERAVPVVGRLGGHVVQGHVDGVGRIVAREHGERWDVVTVALPPELIRYVALKGSVAIDGVSLTVSGLDTAASTLQVSLIPTTLAVTTLGTAGVGDRVNIETDVLAKYVERLLNATDNPDATVDTGATGDIRIPGGRA